jgi:hypothetical protein
LRVKTPLNLSILLIGNLKASLLNTSEGLPNDNILGESSLMNSTIVSNNVLLIRREGYLLDSLQIEIIDSLKSLTSIQSEVILK